MAPRDEHLQTLEYHSPESKRTRQQAAASLFVWASTTLLLPILFFIGNSFTHLASTHSSFVERCFEMGIICNFLGAGLGGIAIMLKDWRGAALTGIHALLLILGPAFQCA